MTVVVPLFSFSRIFTSMLNTHLTKHRLLNSETYFQKLSNKKSDSCSSMKSVKPPNILLYTPGNEMNVSKQIQLLEQCLAPNRYTVYHISSSQFKSDPWMESTETLIVWASKSVLLQNFKHEAMKTILKKYLTLGGKILSFNHQLIDGIKCEVLPHYENDTAEFQYTCESEQKVYETILPVHLWSGSVLDDEKQCSVIDVVVNKTTHCVACRSKKHFSSIITTLQLLATDVTHSDKTSALKVLSYLLHCMQLDTRWNSDVNIVNNSVEQLNKAYLFAISKKIQDHFFERMSSGSSLKLPLTVPGLKFISSSVTDSEMTLQCDPQQMIVVCDDSTSSDRGTISSDACSFDWEVYRNNLTTRDYGKLVIYADVITTTMNVFDGICFKLPDNFGPIAIARQQTQGQGRSSNKWLSPVGCAMFTLVVHVPLSSRLGNALPFLQHIASVAVVHGIRTLPGLQDANFTVKWPNDMYFGTSTKLGGVVVKSTVFRDTCIAFIGCGMNVSNKKPTACVNGILCDEYSIKRTLQCEEVIARTVSFIEEFVEDFQTNGPDSFLKLYYKYWLHGQTDVGVEIDGSTVQCLIVGIDDCGFLRARRHDNGHVVSLHPDGNSFDITKNLIVAKKVP